MLESRNPTEQRYFNRQPVRIDGVDFSAPWQTIVKPLNEQLTALGYERFDKDILQKTVVSNLNRKRPDALNFDPVRVDFDPLNEGYTTVEKAAARLGLQAVYWTGLSEALDAPGGQPFLSGADYQKFSCIPVFKRGNRHYLVGSRATNSISGIQYAGDGDMISNVENRAMQVEGREVPFALFGLEGPYERYLLEYLELRSRLYAATDKARALAAQKLAGDEKVMPYLQQFLPGLADHLGRADEYHSFFYGDLAEDVFQAALPPDSPHALNDLIRQLGLALAFFIYDQTRDTYSRELRWSTDFHQTVRGLGKVTSFMYDSAVDSLYFIGRNRE